MKHERSDDTQQSVLSKPSAGLYVVATPIGNLKDITLRALEVLTVADVIVCEDTRVTGRLLDHYGIKGSMLAYNDHNAASVRPKVISALRDGKVVALVSDAGTPLVSDPGYKLVREAIDEQVAVTSLPGASAALAALAIAGLPSDQFFFAGFLPPKTTGRTRMLEALKTISATLIFYESPNRVAEALSDIGRVLGERQVVMARELTKKFEEVLRGTAETLRQEVSSRQELKGEVVLMVGPPAEVRHDAATVDKALSRALSQMSIKEAARVVAEAYGIPKNEAYRRALELKESAS